MNILYDLISTQPVGNIAFHGGGAYSERIFYEVVKLNKNCTIVGIADVKRELSDSILRFCNKNSVEICFISDKKDLEDIFNGKKIDTFFFSDCKNIFDCTIPQNIRVIFACHDLRVLDMQLDNTLKYYCNSSIKSIVKNQFKIILRPFYQYLLKLTAKKKMERLLDRADIVLTISVFSKYSIFSNFPSFDLRKLRVYYAPSKVDSKNELQKSNAINEKKYFLLISANRYEKNSYRALKALDNVFCKHKLSEYNVICIGMPSFRIRNELLNKEQFIFKDYVSHEDLQKLYKHAHAFIFPSINEGFGYPPLEAMKYGTLVLTSAITSMPELCKDAVLYFEPFSISEIENKILYSIYEDTKVLKEKSIKQFQLVQEKQRADLSEIVDLILKGW